MFLDVNCNEILNVGGILVPLYLTVKNEDSVSLGMSTYWGEKVKNFMYGSIRLFTSGFIITFISWIEDLLRIIGIYISYPTEELYISLTITVYFCEEIIFTTKGSVYLKVENPRVYSWLILIYTVLLNALA